jgi:ribosomal protein L37AE/L43A
MAIICPECRSENSDMIAGGIFGAMRRCNECGYEGIFPEVTPKTKKTNNEKKILKDMKEAVNKK